MTKRERLYHSLVKAGNLYKHKLAKKKLKYPEIFKKPAGIYIDLAVLRNCTEESELTLTQLLDLAMNQNIYLGKTGN